MSCTTPLLLDASIPFVVVAVLPVAALAAVQTCQAGHGFDPLDIFGVLVAELTLDPEAQGCAVGDRQQMPIHSPGKNGLRMEGVDQVDAFIIRRVAEPIGAMEDDVARIGTQTGRIE